MKKKVVLVSSILLVLGFLVYISKSDKQDILLKDNIDMESNAIAMYQSEDGTNYTKITSMPSEGYIVNEEKTYCTTDNKTQVKGKIKTVDGNHIVTGLSKSDKCYVWFDKKIPTSEDTLAKLNITPNNGTPDFSQVATTDEGVYAVSDGMYGGTSYYWRGAVTNNYVKFSNFCWRIIRINGDGSIRLIYDGTTCHANGTNADSIAVASTAYNTSYNQSYYVGWTYTASSQRPSPSTGGTASNAKSQLESWYSSAITGTNTNKVADGKYCNDRNVQGGNTWNAAGVTFYYGGYTRLYTNKIPTLSCDSSDVYTLKVGLVTADEVSYAGGVYGINNKSYYLYNAQNYWTMSPYSWNGGAVMFAMYLHGYLGGWEANNALGLRPVINLKADITFSDGNGTQSSPYIVEG